MEMTFADECGSPRAFRDPDVGILCTRRDKGMFMAAYSDMISARVKDEPVTFIFYHTYDGSHSKAMRLCDFRVPSFRRNLSQVAQGISTSTIRGMYSMVEAELRQFLATEIPKRERVQKQRLLDEEDYEPFDTDPVDTLKENDWLPHHHTTMVAIFKSGEVAVAGPGACSVAIVGKSVQLLSRGGMHSSYANLSRGRLEHDQVLVISDAVDLDYRLQLALESDKEIEQAELGTTFVVAKRV